MVWPVLDKSVVVEGPIGPYTLHLRPITRRAVAVGVGPQPGRLVALRLLTRRDRVGQVRRDDEPLDS